MHIITKILVINIYNHHFENVCCDFLNYNTDQKEKSSKGCLTTELGHLYRDKNQEVKLVPGNSLCPHVTKKCSVKVVNLNNNKCYFLCWIELLCYCPREECLWWGWWDNQMENYKNQFAKALMEQILTPLKF